MPTTCPDPPRHPNVAIGPDAGGGLEIKKIAFPSHFGWDFPEGRNKRQRRHTYSKQALATFVITFTRLILPLGAARNTPKNTLHDSYLVLGLFWTLVLRSHRYQVYLAVYVRAFGQI